MESLITFFVLLMIGIIAGTMNERRHFRRLEEEEQRLAHIMIVNIKRVPDGPQDAILVSGNVVIAIDYFKKIMAAIRMIFGGELRSYQSLLIRARREAILRMKRDADALGADMIYNVRLEFSAVGAQPQVIGGSELLAYGTAVKRRAPTTV